MKTAAIYSASVAFSEELSHILKEYRVFSENIASGFIQADFSVLDFCDEIDITKAYEKLLAFFRCVSDYIKTGRYTSSVVILPSGLGYKDESYLYLMQGMIKSFACEAAEHGSIVNCIECGDRDDVKLAQLAAFFSDSRAYMTSQVLRPDFSRKTPAVSGGKKTVLITGAGQGIGAATAREFASLGYNVCINDISATDKVKQTAEQSGAYLALGDISVRENTDRFISDVIAKFGRIDVFAANAAYMNMCGFDELKNNDLERHIAVNLKGHLNCIDKVVEQMKKQGGGRILLFSSMFGTSGWKNAVSYAGTKTAMIGLGQYLAREMEEYGISVSIISPGVIDTPQLKADADDLGVSVEEVKEIYKRDIPLGRLGTAEDVAYLAGFLGNGGADCLSGRILQTNGGEVRTTPESI
ncbi:MAG: SDR family NAD(P)-dependent oxidoreductase [Ruminiclostridium sp.]